MLVRLEAEEALHTVQVVAMGTGSYKDADQRSIGARWRKQAASTRRPAVVKPTPRDLRAAGIGVRRAGKTVKG